MPHADGLPPVVLYLPGMSPDRRNTSVRIANVLCADLSRQVGTYLVRSLDDVGGLSDGRRIVRPGGVPLFDIYTVAYKDKLPAAELDADHTTATAWVRLLALQLLYFVRILWLVVGATTKAKGRRSKLQLAYGYGLVVALGLLVVLTLISALTALGIWTPPKTNGSFADAFALGLTATTVWLLTKLRPTLRRVAALAQTMLDYSKNRNGVVVNISKRISEAFDTVLDKDPGRPVYLFGYSLGAMVAVDFLCPAEPHQMSQEERERIGKAVAGLVTVGCPLDFVRLFRGSYLENRTRLVPKLDWRNAFNAADVLGSNLIDGDDSATEVADAAEPKRGDPTPVVVSGLRPTRNVRYTNERLTLSSILLARGFSAHARYWDQPSDSNCLYVLREMVAPSNPPTVGSAAQATPVAAKAG